MTDATIIFIASTISGCVAAIPGIINALRLGRVEKKVEVVRNIVDGPLSVALRSNSELAAKLAEANGKHEDITAAAKASIINDNREAGKAEAPQKPR